MGKEGLMGTIIWPISKGTEEESVCGNSRLGQKGYREKENY